MGDYSGIFERCFTVIQCRVDVRNNGVDYEWLMQPMERHFYPDYFTLGGMGRSVIERGLNKIGSHYGGPPFTAFIVMKRLVDLFYSAQPSGENGRARAWLLKRLKRPPKGMVSWCLVEFFLFMEQWMRETDGGGDAKQVQYETIKEGLNQRVLGVLNSIDDRYKTFDCFEGWLMASSVGNWCDVVVPDMAQKVAVAMVNIPTFFSNQYRSTNTQVVGDYFKQAQRTILYECDNAGEIILDLMCIQLLIQEGHAVTIVAKQAPILNDVTARDVQQLILKHAVFSKLNQAMVAGTLKVIAANNFPMVGKYLPMVTQEYRDAVIESDVIWMKGQGNFQTMPLLNYGLFKRPIKYKKRCIYNFVVKAPIVKYWSDQVLDKQVTLAKPCIYLV